MTFGSTRIERLGSSSLRLPTLSDFVGTGIAQATDGTIELEGRIGQDTTKIRNDAQSGRLFIKQGRALERPMSAAELRTLQVVLTRIQRTTPGVQPLHRELNRAARNALGAIPPPPRGFEPIAPWPFPPQRTGF